MPDFGLNFWEILILAVLAVLIFGPDKLPELTRKAARVVRYLRGIANDAKEKVRDELGDEIVDFDPRALHPKQLAKSIIVEPVAEIPKQMRGVTSDVRSLPAEVRAATSPAPAVSAETDTPARGAALAISFDSEAT
ncbi:MAG: Sec-independent protein translocase subunit TatB [Propionibacteriaceae bacterium]|jgi:sec-independent protein translocase protein TatB|nr:Sec-independent protein translocase subunit TatB [Propionibacteriaceae bacterium]